MSLIARTSESDMRVQLIRMTVPDIAFAHPGYLTVTSAPHPLGNPAKILGDDVPVAFGLEIVFLQRAIFGGTRDEGRPQAELLRRLEIVIVRGHHHHLLRRKAEQL